jgi:2-aminoadipate transaminase
MAEGTISFARGAPSADILPVEHVRAASERALADDWERALSYGNGRGHPGLCEWVAAAHDVEPEQVMVTNGSMEAAAFLFAHLVGASDPVVVEQPTYDRTLLLLNRGGAKVTGVALDEDGVDVEALADAARRESPRLVHVIPNFHNPAGCTLSLAKRERLVDLAAEHGFTLFEDDPYREVGFEGEPSPTMHSIDRADRVIYASSFSKTVSPGIRVGYLVGPVEAIAGLAKRANETYISPNMLAGSLVWELCRSGGLAENTESVRRALRARRDALVDALRELIPEADFVVPQGGYFLWLTLDDVDTTALVGAAAEGGVSFVPGADFMLDGGRSSLRLSFAGIPPEQVPEGVARLARALERVRAASPA